MKKFLFLFAALCCMMVANAQEFEVDGIKYNVTSEDDRTVEVIANDYYDGVVIPATVTYIDEDEEEDEGVTYTVTSIGESAFAGCSELTEITIPATVTNIGETAFGLCEKLNKISVMEGNSNYYSSDDEKNYNAIIEKESKTLIAGCKATVIPEDGVTSIGNFAFYGSGIESIEIPASVETIGVEAFSGCSSLATITFAEGSLSKIMESAFNGCYELTSIAIPASVTSIEKNAFYNCSSLEEVTFAGSKLSEIGQYAFYKCSKLASITIPASVETIEASAFASCTQLGTVTFTGVSQLSTIEASAFENCTSLESITIPAAVTRIGDFAFYKNGIGSIEIPASVTSIGKGTFHSCSSLKEVTFVEGSKLSTIGESVFQGCALTSITIPASVTQIGGAPSKTAKI